MEKAHKDQKRVSRESAHFICSRLPVLYCMASLLQIDIIDCVILADVKDSDPTRHSCYLKPTVDYLTDVLNISEEAKEQKDYTYSVLIRNRKQGNMSAFVASSYTQTEIRKNIDNRGHDTGHNITMKTFPYGGRHSDYVDHQTKLAAQLDIDAIRSMLLEQGKLDQFINKMRTLGGDDVFDMLINVRLSEWDA